MKTILLLAVASLALAGCDSTGKLTPAGQNIVGAICATDAIAQPVLVQIVPTLAPQTTAGASADNLLIHPAVVKACAGATPTAVVVAPAPAS